MAGSNRVLLLLTAGAFVAQDVAARPVEESDDSAFTAERSDKGKKSPKKKGAQPGPAPRGEGSKNPTPGGASGSPLSLPVNRGRGPTARPASDSAARPSSGRPTTDGKTVKPPSTPATAPARAASVPGDAPQGATRPYERTDSASTRTPPPHRSTDHRYARPHSHHVRPAEHAHHPPPDWHYYRPYYTHWYVHPYYRWLTATVVVVHFGFAVDPWLTVWAPPPRAGWAWVPGRYDPLGYWIPGHWVPVAGPPVIYPNVRYVFVPGYWQGSVYVEGYWRAGDRDGWIWQEGYYLPDGTYVSGHWEPAGPGPEGYVWEAGYFDGEEWVEGFWRPEFRDGYIWVSSYFDESGIFHGGYWMPAQPNPGHTWIPGWFDGRAWVEGYWVSDQEYSSADPQSWTPPEGWNAGWDSDATSAATTVAPPDEAPLALPVDDSGAPNP